jgi:hypothetical protein
MRLLSIFLAFAALSTPTFGKDNPTITVNVVNTQASTRQFNYTTPGTAGTSNTTCITNGTAIDSGNVTNINANTNCSTTSTPGTPPQTYTHSIAQEHVFAIMPDGAHVTLWCQAGFRHCYYLQPGSYTAEVKGNSLWMYVHDLSGKERKIKYHAVGGW